MDIPIQSLYICTIYIQIYIVITLYLQNYCIKILQMKKLDAPQRRKLEGFIRKKHGNLKKASEVTTVNTITLTHAYKGLELSEGIYDKITSKLSELCQTS